MSMTAFAAPSPSLNTGNTPAEQIVVDSSVTGITAQAGVGNVTGPNSAVAPGTTFATVKGNRTVDASAVLLVVEPTVDTASASHLASALNTKKVKVINQSGEKNISILNNEGKVKISVHQEDLPDHYERRTGSEQGFHLCYEKPERDRWQL